MSNLRYKSVLNQKFLFFRQHFGYLNYVTMISLGMIAGVMGSFVGTPTDLILIRMVADVNLPPGIPFDLFRMIKKDTNVVSVLCI